MPIGKRKDQRGFENDLSQLRGALYQVQAGIALVHFQLGEEIWPDQDAVIKGMLEDVESFLSALDDAPADLPSWSAVTAKPPKDKG
jgi:hypothetical protein